MRNDGKQDAERPKPTKGTDGRFLPGNNGGGGRPLGSRNKLSEAFLEALASDFDQHGKDVIERVRTEEPAAYLRTIVAIVPKRLEFDTPTDAEKLTDDQLEAIIRSEMAAKGTPLPRSKARH